MRSWSSVLNNLGTEFTKGKEFTKSKFVCELHFAKDDVEWDFITKMPDGTMSIIPRERPKLIEGAVPSIFPNMTSCKTQPTISKNLSLNVWGNLQNKCSDGNEFSLLLENYRHLPLPKNWKILTYEGFIVFLHLVSDVNFTSRMLKINQEMKIEVGII